MIVRCTTAIHVLVLGLQARPTVSASTDSGQNVERQECQGLDGTVLLQSRLRSGLEIQQSSTKSYDERRKRHIRGPLASPRPFIEYFKTWAKGGIDARLARVLDNLVPNHGAKAKSMLSVVSDSVALTADEVATSLRVARSAQCAEASSTSESFKEQYEMLSAEVADKVGVSHSLLTSSDGQLQYVAAHRSKDGKIEALVSDPPLCQRHELAFLERNRSLNESLFKSGGESVPLRADDALVNDCKQAFLDLAKRECNETYDFTLLSATVRISDGIEVEMLASLCGPLGKCSKHFPQCNYRAQASKSGAVFLEGMNSSLPHQYLEISLHVPLCECDDISDPLAENASSLMQKSAMGELSLYKGHEHVNDDMPKLDASAFGAREELLATNVDLREEYHKCFPSLPGKALGSETVRNQGICGSCWAFAAATTTMHTLCISNGGSADAFFSAGDRYEVSVQKLISCPSERGGKDMFGCAGGYMSAASQGFRTWGLTHERNNLYKCGGGNPKKHFEQRDVDCARFPWGGTCTGNADPKWLYGGAFGVDGELAMMVLLSQGFSLYGTLRVFDDFMRLRGDGIVETMAGKVRGGHAINIPGYGIQSGKKYWLIQNSWGSDGWGVNGFGKVIRGENYCGIERGAFMVRAWIEGAKPPPCRNSVDGSGLSRTGGKPYYSCEQVEGYCKHPSYGKVLSLTCPVTCDTCGPSNGDEKHLKTVDGAEAARNDCLRHSWSILSMCVIFVVTFRR